MQPEPPHPPSILKYPINPPPPMQDKKVQFAGLNVSTIDPNQPSLLTSMNPYSIGRMGRWAQRKYHGIYESGGTIHSDGHAQKYQNSISSGNMCAAGDEENIIGIKKHEKITERHIIGLESAPAHYFVVNESLVKPTLFHDFIKVVFSYQEKEEVLTIPVLVDLSDQSDETKIRMIYNHLVTVIGIILSSIPGASYVLHGSRALAANLKDQTSTGIIMNAENELPINNFNIPLSEDQRCDIDLATIHTTSGIKNIEKILRESLGSNSRYYQSIITPEITFEQYVSLLSSPRKSNQIRVVTGHSESFKLLHKGKEIFNLDITYAPKETIDPNLPCYHPFKKDSHFTKLKLGYRYFNLRINTFIQSIDDLIEGLRQTNHQYQYQRDKSKNKFWVRLKLLIKLIEQGFIKVNLDLMDSINTAISNSNQQYFYIHCDQASQTLIDTRNNKINTEEITSSNQYTQTGEPKIEQESSTEIINTTAKHVQTETTKKITHETQIATKTSNKCSFTDKIKVASRNSQTAITSKSDKNTETRKINFCDKSSQTNPVKTNNHTQTDNYSLLRKDIGTTYTQTSTSIIPVTWEDILIPESQTARKMTLPQTLAALPVTSALTTKSTLTSDVLKSLSSNVDSHISDEEWFYLLFYFIDKKNEDIDKFKASKEKMDNPENFTTEIMKIADINDIRECLEQIVDIISFDDIDTNQPTNKILKDSLLHISTELQKITKEASSKLITNEYGKYAFQQIKLIIGFTFSSILYNISISYIDGLYYKTKGGHQHREEYQNHINKINIDYIKSINSLINDILDYIRDLNNDSLSKNYNFCSDTIEEYLKTINTIFSYGDYQIRYKYPLLMVNIMKLLLYLTDKRHLETLLLYIKTYLTDSNYRDIVSNDLVDNTILLNTLGSIQDPLPYIPFFSNLFKLYCKNNSFVKAAIMLTNHLKYMSDTDKTAYPDKESKDDLKSESTGVIITKIYTALTEPEVHNPKRKDLKERRTKFTKAKNQFNLFNAIIKCEDYIDSKAFESIKKDNTCKKRLDYWEKNSRA